MLFYFEIDGVVNSNVFAKQWEIQRSLNDWPVFDFTWHGNALQVRTNSGNVPEAELRKMLNLALGHQGRRLIDGITL
ncbi:MAG: hypothetical protein ABSG25_10190 [Bryobacteraceae bacterium]